MRNRNCNSQLSFLFSQIVKKSYLNALGILGTIDYIDTSDGSVIFRTCEIERERLVVQIGTSDPERALQTALKMLVSLIS